MREPVREAGRMKRTLCIFSISLLLFLSNCGGGGGGGSDGGTTPTPAPVADTVLNVPYEPNRGGTCLSSSFAMVLEYYRPSVTFDDVFKIFGLPPFNADVWKKFESWVEGDLNLEMYTYDQGTLEEIIKCIDKGHPVVVLQNLSATNAEGHDRVVIGYNSPKREVILNDPSPYGPSYRMSYDLFTQLWNYKGYGTTELFYLIIPKGSENPLAGRLEYSWY